MSVEVLVEAVQVVPGALLGIIIIRSASRGSTGSTSCSGGHYSVEVLVETEQLVPGVLLDSIVSRSASRGSTGSTSGSSGHYCQ